tara:strand:- start:2822 stop:3532 length:711 start_codon:yes stop_codon:yes gene_type:complete
MKKYNILAVTLARAGSKGIKNKNIVKVNGKPLIYYTIREAKKSKYITDYIVSTDSKKIANVARKYGAEVPFIRPKKLSLDKAKAVDADLHALRWCEKNKKKKYDFFIELMATNPMKTSLDIDNVIKILIKKKADSVIGVTKLEDHHPLRIKKIVNGKLKDFNKLLKEIPETHRQQLKPDAFIRNGSIYAAKRNMIVKKKRYGSKNSIPYIMSSMNSINIDEKKDLELFKILLKKKK